MESKKEVKRYSMRHDIDKQDREFWVVEIDGVDVLSTIDEDSADKFIALSRECDEYRHLLYDMHENNIELSVLFVEDRDVVQAIADKFNMIIRKYNIIRN